MKVFVAKSTKKGNNSSVDYHWCDDNDLLMFGQFQQNKGNLSEVSMCGIQSRKFTTHIVVKDMQISKEYYKELLSESIENSMGCIVDDNGNYEVNIGFLMKFNIDDVLNELLNMADKFSDGQRVWCFGRTIFGDYESWKEAYNKAVQRQNALIKRQFPLL
jgi:hypothetical protein